MATKSNELYSSRMLNFAINNVMTQWVEEYTVLDSEEGKSPRDSIQYKHKDQTLQNTFSTAALKA